MRDYNFSFSDKSLAKLYECHPRLVELMLFAIRTSKDDITVICGFRSNEEQQEAYENGNSRAKAGESKHNIFPSKAIDIAPYPIDWDNIEAFKKLGEHIKIRAIQSAIDIEWGGDWKSFKGDYGHFELI